MGRCTLRKRKGVIPADSVSGVALVRRHFQISMKPTVTTRNNTSTTPMATLVDGDSFPSPDHSSFASAPTTSLALAMIAMGMRSTVKNRLSTISRCRV